MGSNSNSNSHFPSQTQEEDYRYSRQEIVDKNTFSYTLIYGGYSATDEDRRDYLHDEEHISTSSVLAGGIATTSDVSVDAPDTTTLCQNPIQLTKQHPLCPFIQPGSQLCSSQASLLISTYKLSNLLESKAKAEVSQCLPLFPSLLPHHHRDIFFRSSPPVWKGTPFSRKSRWKNKESGKRTEKAKLMPISAGPPVSPQVELPHVQDPISTRRVQQISNALFQVSWGPEGESGENQVV